MKSPSIGSTLLSARTVGMHASLEAHALDNARTPSAGVAVAERVYHPIAKRSHEVPFQTLVDGVRASGTEPREVAYAAFAEAMEGVREFAQ